VEHFSHVLAALFRHPGIFSYIDLCRFEHLIHLLWHSGPPVDRMSKISGTQHGGRIVVLVHDANQL